MENKKQIKAGCVLINLESKQIALVYRKKYSDYSFPKGHLKNDETIKQCASRETEEETGRKNKIIKSKPLGILKYILSANIKVECYIFLAIDEGKSTSIIKAEDKEEIVWINLDDVEKILTFENLKIF